MIAYQETFDVEDSSCIPHVVVDFEDFLKMVLLDFWVAEFPNIPWAVGYVIVRWVFSLSQVWWTLSSSWADGLWRTVFSRVGGPKCLRRSQAAEPPKSPSQRETDILNLKK